MFVQVKWCGLLLVASVLVESTVSWSYKNARRTNNSFQRYYHPYRSAESESNESDSLEDDSHEFDSHELYSNEYQSREYGYRESGSLESDEYIAQTPVEMLSERYEDFLQNGTIDTLNFNSDMFPMREDPFQNYKTMDAQVEAEFGTLERNLEDKFIWQYETDDGAKGKLRPIDLDRHKIKYAIRTFGKCHYCKCGTNLRNKDNQSLGSGLAGKYEFPWMVGIYKKAVAWNQFLCAGTLINDRFVATGSMCNKGLLVHQLRYSILEYDLKARKDQSFIRKATAVYKPTHYLTFPGSRDLALHKLLKRVPIGWGLLRPICLPHSNFVYKGRSGIVAGWGDINGQRSPNQKLHTARLNVLSNNQCSDMNPTAAISSYHLCTTRSQRSQVCTIADKGSPLMMKTSKGRYFLAGITQYNPFCSAKSNYKYMLYTKVAGLRYFILRLTSGACTCRI